MLLFLLAILRVEIYPANDAAYQMLPLQESRSAVLTRLANVASRLYIRAGNNAYAKILR